MLLKRLLFLLTSLSLVVACTQKQDTYNHHSETPQIQSPESESESADFLQAARSLENLRGNAYEDVYSFFKSYLTAEFFKKYAVEKDPQQVNALMKFHLRIILDLQNNPQNRDKYKSLSFEYYQLIKNICSNDFSECNELEIFKSSVYAADIFLLAEASIDESEKVNFNTFVTSIGNPSNNPHILQKRLDSMVDQLKKGELTEDNQVESLLNLMVYLTVKTDQVQVEPLIAIFDVINKPNANINLVLAFENVLSSTLEKSNSQEVQTVLQNYLNKIVTNSTIYKAMEENLHSGLIQNKFEGVHDRYKSDLKLYFTLLGLLKPQYATTLHTYIAREVLSVESKSQDLLNLTEAYIYKKLIINVYESHRIIGEIFTNELKKHGKVEAIFFEFFGKADGELANLWLNSFKLDILNLEKNLSTYFKSEELIELRKVITNLDRNIRNLVMYPCLFITGYHAVKQGNFDLQLVAPGGVLVHIDDKLYFRDLIEGRLPGFFQFLPVNSATAQENLLALYFSLDEKILGFYDLDYSFLDTFISRYMENEQQYLTNKTQSYLRFFGPNSLGEEMKLRCEKIKAGNFNFGFEQTFANVDRHFFFGDISTTRSSSLGSGTTKELLDYTLYFNQLDIKNTLSEGSEMLRLDLGPKMNHLTIISQALREQSKAADAQRIDGYVQKIADQTKSYQNTVKTLFKENLDCAFEHGLVASKMRKYYFKNEIEYIRSTYEALSLLNSLQDPTADLSIIRSQSPQSFLLPYLKDLPLTGSFIDELNKLWLNIGRETKDLIVDYKQESEFNLGFKKNNADKYIFSTNTFEDRFRMISFMTDPSFSGHEFPRAEIINIPQNYKQLDIIFGEKKDHYYSWEIKNGEKSFEDFAFKILSTVHSPMGGKSALVELDATQMWKIMMMNLSSIYKLESHSFFAKDYDYKSYKGKLSSMMETQFDYMAELTDKILNHINIDEDEEEIADLLKERSLLRLDRNRINANTLFVYYPLTQYIELGQYDIFFSTLVSYRLGQAPKFRSELFGYGEDDLLRQFLPNPNPSGMGPGNNEITADELLQRRDPKIFSERNYKIAEDWEETILFDLDELSRKTILHDLFHPIHADHALADSFLDWVKQRENDNIERVPYRFDLVRYRLPFVNPEYIYPSILDRYWDTRRQFDTDTGHVFNLN